jgi:serine/threonine-protein kinase
MPFIDGETLRAKLDRETQLGVDEAIRIASDVASALHYAHTHGVIHRDIKPENILLHDGRPMVADFGIALAVSAAAGGRMTETGLSLGTPHYMSPEQATAEKDITARADQYSLASVLYEMLTGNPPHIGATAQQIIMKIITEEAQDVTALRKSVPRAVADAVAQALEKLPADRFASTAEFAGALVGEGGVASAARGGARATALHAKAARADRPWRRVAVGASIAAVAALAVALWALSQRGSGGGERVEFAYRAILESHDRPHIAISNDGQRIAHVRVDTSGVPLIAIRDLGSSQMRVLVGTNGANEPIFSPDGSWILYQASGRLWRVPADGGPPTAVVDSVNNPGGSIGPDGAIYYSHSGLGLHRMPASGGPSVALTTLDRAQREFGHWTPQVLPGEKAVLFTNYLAPATKSRLEAVIIATGERKVIVEGAVFGRYVNSGHLLFARDGAIFAVAFDPKSLRVSGNPVPVVDDVFWSLTNGLAAYAVSGNGTLVYVRGSAERVEKQVVWADRRGNVQPVFAQVGSWEQPVVSPDGRWLALTGTDPSAQIWLYDNSRRVLSQLTRFTDGIAFAPVWMPDSRTLIISREVPQYDIWRQPIDGSAATPVIANQYDKVASAVSADGRHVVFAETVSQDVLKIAPLAGGEARVVNVSPLDQVSADFSPDGRWVVYDEANAAGTLDVFVRDTASGSGRRPVSATGGSQPLFTKNGREIVYRRGGAVFAASFDPRSGEVGTPELLFVGQDGGRAFGGARGYDVTPDGARFLLSVPVERPGATPTVVVTNWFDELRRKVPR